MKSTKRTIFILFMRKRKKRKNKEQTNTNKKTAKYNIKMMEDIKKKMNATIFLLN